MAEDSIGFDVQNGIGESAFANVSPFLGSLLPVINTVGTHTVRAGTSAMTVDVTNGISACFGVRHNITTTTNLTIPAVTLAGAVRWDAVVKRFDWSNNSATIMLVPGTAAVSAQKVAPAGLFALPGEKYDQLLALVKATNGSTALEIADRRIWASKDFTVATPDAIPTATTALYGASVYVVSELKNYRCLLVSGSPGWVPDSSGITEITGVAVLAAATGWAVDGTHVNRCLVQPYSRQMDLELRRSGAEINAANSDGNFTDTPVAALTATCRPDRPIPVRVDYLTTDGKEFGGDARLDPDGTLWLLGGAVARNVAQATAVGTVSLRASIRFDRRTA